MVRKIGQIILIVAAAVLFTATVLSLLPLNRWWSRIFDFPRIQIIGLAGLVLILYGIFFRLRPRANALVYIMLVGVIVYQSIQIHPYTPLSSPQTAQEPVQDSTTLVSMIISNVLMTNREANALLQVIQQRDPDLVLLMETDRWWQQQMQPLEDKYEHQVLQPLDNTYGMLLYSRLPLHQPEVRYLLNDSIPSIHTYFTLPSGQWVKLYCLHPRPPVPGHSKTSTERDAELLLVGEMVEGKKEPAIVMGDLNDVAWSPTSKLFRETSQMLDPRIGRGFYNTFHAQYPFLRWPLDHVFHTDHFQLAKLAVLPTIGSDHFPFYFSLSFQPDEDWQQKRPKPATQEEEEKSEEVIEKGFEEEEKKEQSNQ